MYFSVVILFCEEFIRRLSSSGICYDLLIVLRGDWLQGLAVRQMVDEAAAEDSVVPFWRLVGCRSLAALAILAPDFRF